MIANEQEENIQKKRPKVDVKISNYEESIMSDASINSNKTDCEVPEKTSKIKVYPLDNNQIFAILSDYFDSKLDEQTFHKSFCYGQLFDDLEVMKTVKPVKFNYMRKRVCYKLFTVFEKIVKLIVDFS